MTQNPTVYSHSSNQPQPHRALMINGHPLCVCFPTTTHPCSTYGPRESFARLSFAGICAKCRIEPCASQWAFAKSVVVVVGAQTPKIPEASTQQLHTTVRAKRNRFSVKLRRAYASRCVAAKSPRGELGAENQWKSTQSTTRWSGGGANGWWRLVVRVSLREHDAVS